MVTTFDSSLILKTPNYLSQLLVNLDQPGLQDYSHSSSTLQELLLFRSVSAKV